MNSDPWSYMIYFGLGYLVKHVVSTKLSIDITILSSYCIILNHPVTGSVMLLDFKFKILFLSIYYYQVGNYNIYTEFVPWHLLSFPSW